MKIINARLENIITYIILILGFICCKPINKIYIEEISFVNNDLILIDTIKSKDDNIIVKISNKGSKGLDKLLLNIFFQKKDFKEQKIQLKSTQFSLKQRGYIYLQYNIKNDLKSSQNGNIILDVSNGISILDEKIIYLPILTTQCCREINKDSLFDYLNKNTILTNVEFYSHEKSIVTQKSKIFFSIRLQGQGNDDLKGLSVEYSSILPGTIEPSSYCLKISSLKPDTCAYLIEDVPFTITSKAINNKVGIQISLMHDSIIKPIKQLTYWLTLNTFIENK